MDTIHQFKNIKEISKDRFAITYSAIWTDYPKYNYDDNKEEWKLMRNLNKRVALKYLQNTNEFLNLVYFLINLMFNFLLLIYIHNNFYIFNRSIKKIYIIQMIHL